MPDAEFENFKLYYEVHGEGTPLLLVPGLNGTFSFWHEQIEPFAADFQVVIHDHRGTGRSTHSRIRYSIEQMTADLLALMDHLEIERAHFVGVSTGGAMGQVMATDHRDRLKSVVLANTWTKADAFRKRIATLRKTLVLESGPEAYVNASPLFLYPSWWIRDHGPQLEAMDTKALANFPHPEIAASRLDAGIAFDRREQLPNVTTPTLIVGARDDHLTPAYYAEELAALIPGAALAMLDRGGHACAQTVPEEFNERVLSFLHTVEQGRR